MLASWLGQIGGASAETVQGRTVMYTAGNMYIGGSFASTVADFDLSADVSNLASAGASDAYVAKHSAEGNLLWARRFGGSLADATNSLRLNEQNGSVYITGTFEGSADFTGDGIADLTSKGGADVFIAKLNSTTGATIWQKAVGGSGTDNGNDIAVYGGAVYVGGDFRATADFNPGSGIASLTPAGKGKNLLEDGFILKLTEAGDFISVSQIGSARSDTVQSLEAIDSGLHVLGMLSDTVDIDPTATSYTLSAGISGAQVPFLARYSYTGTVSWGRVISGVEIPRLVTLSADSGFLYVTGEFGQTANFNVGGAAGVLTSAGSRDAFVAKYAQSNGSFEWARSMGGSGYDTARGAAVVDSSSGSVYVGGWFVGTVDFNPGAGNGGELTSAGESDNFIWKLDATGDYQDAWRMGGSLADGGAKPVGAISGTLSVAGRFQAQGDFPTGGSLASKGSLDVFLMAFDESTLIGSAAMGAAGTISASLSEVYDSKLSVEDAVLDNQIGDALAELFQPSKRKRNLSDAVDEIFAAPKSAKHAWATELIE